jgi:hypothetical protein
MSNANFLVRKSDFHQTLLRDTPDLPLGEGEVRVRIDRQQHHLRGVWRSHELLAVFPGAQRCRRYRR